MAGNSTTVDRPHSATTGHVEGSLEPQGGREVGGNRSRGEVTGAERCPRTGAGSAVAGSAVAAQSASSAEPSRQSDERAGNRDKREELQAIK